jgi:hypothetical protein
MTTLVRQLDGTLLYPGQVVKRLYEPFMPGGSLPSWLAAQAGTASFADTANGSFPSYARFTTAASVNAGARLWYTLDIRADMYTAIVWTLGGLRFDADTPMAQRVRLELATTASSRGIALMQNQSAVTDTTCVMRGYIDATHFQDTTLNYQILADSGFSRNRRNITLAWLPLEGLAYVLEDDQVLGSAVVSNADKAGGVRPMLTMSTTDAVARWFEVTSVELRLYH